MAIEIIHESVLKYLLDNKYECFSLRMRDEEKFKKGYWFLGNEGFLNFSFWNSKDWRNKTPNIFFSIEPQGNSWVELVDTDGSNKAQFFEEIAPVLGFKRLKKKRNEEERYVWVKNNAFGNDYIKSLEDFLKKDKPIIDAFIISKNMSKAFPAISKDVFQKTLSKILSWRKKINEDCEDCPPPVILSVTQSYSLRLKKLIFENISHFNYIELNLDQQVTCLIGENGSGKSSILRGIALGLAGVSDNTVIDPNHEAIQKMLRIERIEGRKELFASKGLIRIVYNENNDKNIITFQHLKGETVDTTGAIQRDFNKVEDSPDSDLTATRDNNFVNLVLGFSQIKSQLNGNGKIPIDDDLRPRISEVTSLIYNQPDPAFKNFIAWIIEIWSATTNPDARQKLSDILDTIFSVVQKIVGGTFELIPMQVEQKEVFIKTTDMPQGIPVRLISQGYNNVIGWVGYFMKRLWEVTGDMANFKQTPAVCLIDEIDTYLHPKWEQKILSVLAEEFPNTQFVVTTHSPLIITHLKNIDNSVAIYHISEQGVKTIQASGQDISTAMQMHFGIERRPLFYQNQIDKLFSNIEKFEESTNGVTIETLEHELNNLKSLLGETDPDVETATRILETFKIPTEMLNI